MWDPDELRLAEQVVSDVEGTADIERSQPPRQICLSRSGAEPFHQGLSCRIGGALTRYLLATLECNEEQVTRWRLEHKLVQALVLHRLLPDLVPVTTGLDRAAQQSERNGSERLSQTLSQRLGGQFFLKPALGYGSGDRADADNTRQILHAAARKDHLPVTHAQLEDEEYIAQRRLRIVREYRVHTFERRSISGLNFRRYDATSSVDELKGAIEFVEQIVSVLPAGIVSGVLAGWDVARLVDGTMAIVEVNYTGRHHFYHPGYHCSGILANRYWGPMCFARLCRHIEDIRKVDIKIDPENDHDDDLTVFCIRARTWLTVFKCAAQVTGVTNELSNPRDAVDHAIPMNDWCRWEMTFQRRLLAPLISSAKRVQAAMPPPVPPLPRQ